MNQNQVSLTAMMSAFLRCYHSAYDNPKVFDDFVACRLFSEEEHKMIEGYLVEGLPFYAPESAALQPDRETALRLIMRAMTTPTILGRSRYTEENLEASLSRGVEQYVMLGAGLDTFAFRRPDMADRLQVFEIDHPATQASKLERVRKAGLELPANLHFVAIDFTKQSLPEVIKSSEYSPRKLSFFSWLGVTYYLTPEEVFSTLHAITEMAPRGSLIVFDYMDTDALIPEKTAPLMQKMQLTALKAGEPMITGFDPCTLGEELAAAGLRLVENLGPGEIEKRYFIGTEGYHATEHINYALAIVK